ncbi:hypothetical protein JTF06_07720 [Desemzia sp. RIT804]|uniref:hypothetical protein n=1 Tax=Desemzia sp. RIT 804 TaxID=2810209 RepID=UPI001950411F|nr:hypothetical protein [Desemzia sp. RIT 804]MBM6614778.1 hypothetical protein [Desemzia sp. RIT 804]
MRMKQIVELAKVNMIYANPQMIEKRRNKETKKGKASKVSAYMYLLGQNVLLFVMFLFLFGFMFSSIDLAQYPGMFTTFIATIILMALLQGFYLIFNLFYDSKDLAHYLPLPFKASEIFIAKVSVLIFMLLPYLVPVLILLVLLGIDAGKPLLLVLPGSIGSFLLIMAVVLAFSILLVHLITKFPLFENHKQGVITALYSLSSIGMVVSVYFLSNRATASMDTVGEVIPDMSVIPFLDVFHRIFLEPDNAAWFGILGWILVLAILSLIVFKVVVPSFYQAEQTTSVKPSSSSKKQAKNKNRGVAAQSTSSINQTLVKYNFGIIQDGTLMMQFLSSKLLLPLVVIGPTLFSGPELAMVPTLFWPVFLFSGLIYAFLTLNAVSIVGVIISLDRENFLYLKSLPFSMEQYLRQKFLFAFSIELILPAILAISLIVFFQVPLLFGVLFLMGLVVGTFVLSHYYFVRDYRLLDLEWQNLTELFTRGAGTWIQVISIFITVFFGVLAVVAVSLILLALPPLGQLVFSIAVVLIPLIVSAVVLFRYKKTFWKQFKE